MQPFTSTLEEYRILGFQFSLICLGIATVAWVLVLILYVILFVVSFGIFIYLTPFFFAVSTCIPSLLNLAGSVCAFISQPFRGRLAKTSHILFRYAAIFLLCLNGLMLALGIGVECWCIRILLETPAANSK